MGILGSLVAVAWLTDRARSHHDSTVEKEIPPKETFDNLLLSNDYSELKKEIVRLNNEFASELSKASLPLRVSNIRKSIQLVSRALEISKTDEEKAWALSHKINFSMMLETEYAVKNLEETGNSENLLKLVEAHRDNPAKDVQIEVAFANILLPLLKTRRDKSEKFDRRKVLDDIEKLIVENPNDLILARRLSGVEFFFKNDDRQNHLAFLETLEKGYSNSSLAAVRGIAGVSRLKRVVTTYRLLELEAFNRKISDQDQKLLAGILTVVENERLDLLLARRLIASCHILEDRKAYALAIKGFLGVEEKLKSEQDPQTEPLVKLTNAGTLRCEAFGKKLPLEFTDQTGRQYEPSDFDGQPVFIAILDDQTQNAVEQVELLKTLISYRTGEGLQPIVMLQNTKLDTIAKFANLLEGQVIVVGHPVSKSKIGQAFPATNTPIYLFLDGEQNLVAVTQKTSEVITRVSSLIHKVKKARLQSN